MDRTSMITARILCGDLPEGAMDVHLACVQQITCSCGAILDDRRSVYLERKSGGACSIVCGACYDAKWRAIAEAKPDLVTVHDARTMYPAPEPKAPPKPRAKRTHAHGRCKRCRLIYRWPVSDKRTVAEHRCTCGRALRRTVAQWSVDRVVDYPSN